MLPTHESDAVERAVRQARRAPSTHNTQPWTFRLTADGLEVAADPARALPAVDPGGRELIISCGVALHHLRVALAAEGFDSVVEPFPKCDAPLVAARVRLGGRREPTAGERGRAELIERRHTDRGPYRRETLTAAPLDDLRTLAADEGAHLTFVRGPEQRSRLADVVEEADLALAMDDAVLRELISWLRIPSRHDDDGLPVRTILHTPAGHAADEREQMAVGPTLLVLSTPHDTPVDWLAAGQALSAVLLSLTASRLSASFFDAPIEVPTLRSRVGEIAGAPGVPQLLLRVGHGPGGAESPRRSLEDVLER